MLLTRMKFFFKTDLGIATLIFYLTLAVRGLYIAFFVSPLVNIQALPYHNTVRALAIANGTDVYFADAWSLYYLPLGFLYKGLQFLGLPQVQWPLVVVLLNLLFTAVTAGCLYILARTLVRKLLAAIIAGVYIVYFQSLYLSTLVLSEALYEMLLVLGVLLIFKAKKNGKLLIIAGLVFGWAVVLRPILLPFLPFLVGWLWWQKQSRRLFFHGWVGLVIGFLIGVLPFLYANTLYSHHGRWELSGSLGPNLVLNYCQAKKVSYDTPEGSFWFSPPALWQTDLPELAYDRPFYESDYYFARAVECIWQRPQVFVENLTNIKRLFWSEFYPEPEAGSVAYYSQLMLFWRVLLIFFSLGAVIGMLVVDKRKFGKLVLLYGLFGSLVVSVYLVNPGEERYLVPYAWVLFVGCGGVVEQALMKVPSAK